MSLEPETTEEWIRREQYRQDKYARAEKEGCPRCKEMGTEDNPIDEQYSFGFYAGFFCKKCAIRGYRDQCGHGPEGQGNPYDLDEQVEDDY
jgi:hypothetical protein